MSSGAPVLLVTGGSRGIGAAISTAASEAGWTVVMTYNDNREAAEKLVASLGERGGHACALQADVGESASIEGLFDAVESRFGPLSGLVNNAGITGRIGSFVDLPESLLRRVMDVNVLGTMLYTQAAVRRWLSSGSTGVVVNVSSIASTLGSAGEYVHYAASKAAIDTFTLGLAREVGPHGIRVNAVAPGTTETDIHAAGGDPGRAERVAPRVPLRRVAEPREIAEVVVWLLSKKSSYVTGSVVRAGGGL